MFPNAKVPRTANFNPEVASGANWISKLHYQQPDQVAANDFYFRRRVQTLQSIDEMVEGIVQKLDSYGILDDTFIIYTSDNGYHIGQHRLPPGKVTGYEEDINVPLIIRGPGVPAGQVVNFSSSHTDLAPTILSMLNLPVANHDFDGFPIPFTAEDISNATVSNTRHEHVNIEFWGTPSNDNNYSYAGLFAGVVNTYKGVRVVSEDYSFYYICFFFRGVCLLDQRLTVLQQVWCDHERELYDMKADPGQMHNLINSTSSLLGRPIQQIINRLDALLLVLKTCKTTTCQHPWATLQPNTNIHNLQDALDSSYDNFYTQQVKVGWTVCDRGFIIAAEGPQWDTDGKVYRHKKPNSKRDLLAVWPEWT